MVAYDKTACPSCGGCLKSYDRVQRIIRTKGRATRHEEIRRMRCSICGTVHRELPDYILPYKQYESEVIRGVLEGFITSDTIGYEDYPCEMTMIRWKSRKIHLLL
jgi:rubredoxin